ncbi:hypothetical protein QE370_000217 [Aeromicrobium sp. SORGH_AS981]|nr:hypothetical protein [Aeromicrobium sp. SORGH_AS_0981]
MAGTRGGAHVRPVAGERVHGASAHDTSVATTPVVAEA